MNSVPHNSRPLATDNAPDPVAVITSTFLKTPRQAVIDALGNAWITDPASNMVMTYTAAQLAQTGTNAIPPVLLISSAQFNGPSGIAFDSSGNLWISNNGIPAAAADQFGGGTTIIEITAAHIPRAAGNGHRDAAGRLGCDIERRRPGHDPVAVGAGIRSVVR